MRRGRGRRAIRQNDSVGSSPAHRKTLNREKALTRRLRSGGPLRAGSGTEVVA